MRACARGIKTVPLQCGWLSYAYAEHTSSHVRKLNKELNFQFGIAPPMEARIRMGPDTAFDPSGLFKMAIIMRSDCGCNDHDAGWMGVWHLHRPSGPRGEVMATNLLAFCSAGSSTPHHAAIWKTIYFLKASFLKCVAQPTWFTQLHAKTSIINSISTCPF